MMAELGDKPTTRKRELSGVNGKFTFRRQPDLGIIFKMDNIGVVEKVSDEQSDRIWE